MNASITKTGIERVLSVRQVLRISNRQSTVSQSHNLQPKFERVYSRTLHALVTRESAMVMDTNLSNRELELELGLERNL